MLLKGLVLAAIAFAPLKAPWAAPGVLELVNSRDEAEWVQFHTPKGFGFFYLEPNERVRIRGVDFEPFLSICLDEDGDTVFTLHERIVVERKFYRYTLE